MRIWRVPGQEGLTRAEVQHMQSGTSITGRACDVAWIAQTLEERLAPPPAEDDEVPTP